MAAAGHHHLPWNRSTRSIYIDRKYFSIQFDDQSFGSRAIISEQGRHPHSISITWKALHWLADSISQLYRLPFNVKFFRTYRGESDTIWIEKKTNRFGHYVEVSVISQKGARSFLIIPAEENRTGWNSFHSLIADYPGKSGVANNKSYVQAVEQKTHVSSPPKPHPHFPPLSRSSPPSSTPSACPPPATANTDEALYLIVERPTAFESWSSILISLKSLSGRCVINPFQPHKALVHLHDEQQTFKLRNSHDLVDIGPYKLRFFDYHDPAAYLFPKVLSQGGWIDILNLPLYLWTDDIFKFIGDACGGWVDTASQNLRQINPTSARIRVQQNESGFLPATIVIPPSVAGGEIQVQIRGLSPVSQLLPAHNDGPDTQPPHLFVAKAVPEFPPDLKGKKPCSASDNILPNLSRDLCTTQSPASLSTLNPGPSKSSSPSISQPSLSAITFPPGPTNLQLISTNYTAPHPPTISDSEPYLSSPTSTIPPDDFIPLLLDPDIFGDRPHESNLTPLAILPPLPPDLSPTQQKPSSSTLALTLEITAPQMTSSPLPNPSISTLSFPDIASLLSEHGLCISPFHPFPPLSKNQSLWQQKRKSCSGSFKICNLLFIITSQPLYQFWREPQMIYEASFLECAWSWLLEETCSH